MESVERWLKYVCSFGYSTTLCVPLLSLHSDGGECISVSYGTPGRRIRRDRNALWLCSTLLYTAWIKLNRSVQPRNEGRSANPLAIRFAIVRPDEKNFLLSLSLSFSSFFFSSFSPSSSFFVRQCRLVINLIFHRVITGRLMAATSYFSFVSIFFLPLPPIQPRMVSRNLFLLLFSFFSLSLFFFFFRCNLINFPDWSKDWKAFSIRFIWHRIKTERERKERERERE